MGKPRARKRITCEICGEPIDRGACGQAFAIITIKDDQDNDPATYNQKRVYLCDGCTLSLETWILDKGLDRALEVEA